MLLNVKYECQHTRFQINNNKKINEFLYMYIFCSRVLLLPYYFCMFSMTGAQGIKFKDMFKTTKRQNNAKWATFLKYLNM